MSNDLTQADIERLKATLAKADIDLPLSYQKAKPGVDPDCAIYDCDNRFLAASFHHVGKTRFTDSEKFADLTTDVLNTLPALLEAAERGILLADANKRIAELELEIRHQKFGGVGEQHVYPVPRKRYIVRDGD